VDSGAPHATAGRAVVSRLRSLCEDVLIESEPDRLVVVSRWGEIPIDHPSDAVRRLLTRMSLGPVSMDNVLPTDVLPTDAQQKVTVERQRAELTRVLDLISGSVEHTLSLIDGSPLLSVIPTSAHARFTPRQIADTTWLGLSRFAAIRRVDGCLNIESPLARHRVVLHRPIVSALVAALATPKRRPELGAPGLAPAVISEAISYLVAACAVVEGRCDAGSAEVVFAEDTDPELTAWSHHDLLFHAQSRMGLHAGASGTAFRLGQLAPSPPVSRALPAGQRFALPRPVEPWTGGATLAELLVRTPASVTEFDDEGPTHEELGVVLFRAARIRAVRQASTPRGAEYVISDRPYPSVSGLYEFELYLSVNRSDGLPRGIYHYDPAAHGLTLVNTSSRALDEVFDTIRAAAGLRSKPPLVISIAARLGRRSRVYGGISYAATLMHLGLLHQTLHLVAHATGLATCLLTTDEGDIIDRALLLDSPAETTVGDLVLGRPRPPGSSAR
jgi:SagB-type dehydrogenase family enzyme